MCTAYFQDGKPIDCPNVMLEELYVLYRVTRIAKARIQCRFHYGSGLILLDIYQLDAAMTFGAMYRPEHFAAAA